MKKFDFIITLGDSWSWGSELPENQRTNLRFDKKLSNMLGIDCINLSREGASNFCYKWHLLEYIQNYTLPNHTLVVVGITAPDRHLIWNNQADYFQESPERLVSETTVIDNWGNQKGQGGFVRATPHYMDFPNSDKKRCHENFYRYNYDDTMAEIYTLWEIKLLDTMIKEQGALPIFWSNCHPYQQVNLPWAKKLLENCQLVNFLKPFEYTDEHFYYKHSHPNEKGHTLIADFLYQNISD
jgi:hypothetical protein